MLAMPSLSVGYDSISLAPADAAGIKTKLTIQVSRSV